MAFSSSPSLHLSPPPPLSQQVLLLEDAAAAKNTAQAAGWCLICLDTLEAAGALAPGPLG